MTEQDTIRIYANLSACMWRQQELNVIVKKNNKVLLKSFIGTNADEFKNVELDWVEYKNSNDDTVNFEHLFKSLSLNHQKSDESRETFIISSKNDTISYYTNGLGDLGNYTQYYFAIKRKLYPNFKLYNFVEDTTNTIDAPIIITN